MNLADVQSMFSDVGCQKLYAKLLAENDNPKHGVYLGSGFEVLNLFPTQEITSESNKKNPIFKAKVNFGWLAENATVSPAPHTKFILYPQYPEVRLSGFLAGCSSRPSKLMNKKVGRRVLFLGLRDRTLIGFVVHPSSAVAREFYARFKSPTVGVFVELPLPTALDEASARRALLRELKRIHKKGWINSKQLSADGTVRDCNAPQCGGFTLEAELGIPKNSNSDPDFGGWEVKQHGVTNFDRVETGKITLMTPEPTGGYYRREGVQAFVRKYGYADRSGTPDRLNFSVIHKVGVVSATTGMKLKLRGYDVAEGKIMDPAGAVELITSRGSVAAAWSFAGLLTHWTRKHSNAVYVPSQKRTEPHRQYRYGNQVRLGTGTDFLLFLRAMAAGSVYYDPGLKIESASLSPKTKARSQFRVSSRNISSLYENVELVSLLH